MPTVVSLNIIPCSVSPSASNRIIQNVQDVSGLGVIQWTLDGGSLPVNMNQFEVYANGKRLDYLAEYTVLQFSNYAEITVLFPVPGAFYTMIKYL
jgi:hypothetical protein